MKLNLYTWHSNRQLPFCPKHFTIVKTELSDEAKLWILENLNGRFYIGSISSTDNFLSHLSEYPAFEDPQEAVLYQLKWS